MCFFGQSALRLQGQARPEDVSTPLVADSPGRLTLTVHLQELDN